MQRNSLTYGDRNVVRHLRPPDAGSTMEEGRDLRRCARLRDCGECRSSGLDLCRRRTFWTGHRWRPVSQHLRLSVISLRNWCDAALRQTAERETARDAGARRACGGGEGERTI